MIKKYKKHKQRAALWAGLLVCLVMTAGCGSDLLITREDSGYRIQLAKDQPQDASASETEASTAPFVSSPAKESIAPETKAQETAQSPSKALEAQTVSIKEAPLAENPEAVKDPNGLEPIQESSEKLTEDSPDSLQPDPGQTGDGLVFDPLFYPFYNMLDACSQTIYRQIYANASALNASFTPASEVNTQSLGTIFEAVYNDHPELFWLDNSYSYKYLSDGSCAEITLNFNETANNLESAKQLFEAKAEALLQPARALGSDYEKELYVHDALIAGTDYQIGAPLNQSAYSALANGRTVCSGYARAFQYLMQKLGIPCYLTTGYSRQNHAWNIVKLGDGYYNVDPTWDDVDSGIYDFFNKTDREFQSTHKRQGLSLMLPACNGGQYSGMAPDTRPSPADFGLSEADVLNSLEDYYIDCYSQLTALGTGSAEFQNLIPKSLWSQIQDAYNSGSYKQGYGDRILQDLEAGSYQVSIEATELQGDYYLLRHLAEIY